MKPWPLSRCIIGYRPGEEPVSVEGMAAAKYRLRYGVKLAFDLMGREPGFIVGMAIIAAIVVLVAFGLAGHPLVGR